MVNICNINPRTAEKRPERIFSYWFFSVPTGFLLSTWGFFFIERHESGTSRPIIRSEVLPPIIGLEKINSSVRFWSKKWLIRPQWQSYCMIPRKNTTTNTRAHHETKQGIFRVFTHKKNPIFCRIADFIPLSLSHFFPSKNFHFCRTFVGQKLIHQVPLKLTDIFW